MDFQRTMLILFGVTSIAMVQALQQSRSAIRQDDQSKKCTQPCPKIRSRVCDSVGVTHANECIFKIAQCKAEQEGKPIFLAGKGSCSRVRDGIIHPFAMAAAGKSTPRNCGWELRVGTACGHRGVFVAGWIEKFTKFDINKDGKITWEEFHQTHPSNHKFYFNLRDKDHNGIWDLTEYKNTVVSIRDAIWDNLKTTRMPRVSLD